jgi:predicted O-methyltransferase YrrM
MVTTDTVDGWLFTEEGDLLEKYVNLVCKDRTVAEGSAKVLELGSYKGKSTLRLASNPVATVFAVDTFDARNTTVGSTNTLQDFINNTYGHNNITIVPTTTENAKILTQNFRLPIYYDLIFVDADHSYEGCKKDVTMFLPHLKSGGYLIMHDAFGEKGEEVDTPWPGVTRVYKELRNEKSLEFVEKCRRCAVFKRLE